MKRFISYPKIEQFRNTIVGVRHMATYVGQDENGEPTYNLDAPLPSILMKGTVKIHGTNSGICYNSIDGMWAQSRSNIITVEKDNAGFCFFVESNKEAIQKLMDIVVEREGVNTETHNVAIFGEFCGGNIQKGVAITGLDKMMVIFGVKIAPIEKDLDNPEPSRWVNHHDLRDNDNMIFNIEDFPVYEVDIDFNRPEFAQKKFIELVDEVEKLCPVGKVFGVEGVGEGIVWKGWYKDCQLMFKTKGILHVGKGSKCKTIAPIDIEKMESVHEFVEVTATEERMTQGIQQVFESETPNIRGMGKYISWVVADILCEEKDTLIENKLEPKDVKKHISDRCRPFFQKYLDEQAGL